MALDKLGIAGKLNPGLNTIVLPGMEKVIYAWLGIGGPSKSTRYKTALANMSDEEIQAEYERNQKYNAQNEKHVYTAQELFTGKSHSRDHYNQVEYILQSEATSRDITLKNVTEEELTKHADAAAYEGRDAYVKDWTEVIGNTGMELIFGLAETVVDVIRPINPITGNPMTGRPLDCLLYTSPSPRDRTRSRMPSSA